MSLLGFRIYIFANVCLPNRSQSWHSAKNLGKHFCPAEVKADPVPLVVVRCHPGSLPPLLRRDCVSTHVVSVAGYAIWLAGESRIAASAEAFGVVLQSGKNIFSRCHFAANTGPFLLGIWMGISEKGVSGIHRRQKELRAVEESQIFRRTRYLGEPDT